MSASHTLGPWIENGFCVMESSGALIAELFAHEASGDMPSDAKLIAAAPDMLAALQSLTNEFKYSTDVCDIARAAIAKATA